ncbi:hypothetical protein [Nocardioides bruguierae]|uniref:ABC transporter domain-containing protein n=1 Tax=Nocardioides bruguierae TaxID=2945102 RepID=A0A9X2D5A5_9ACTN|nr:hypothetical protein [Nocardioides bruguierae]MCM0619264.1 hypothetical protein [Nocardioides bruguierae]
MTHRDSARGPDAPVDPDASPRPALDEPVLRVAGLTLAGDEAARTGGEELHGVDLEVHADTLHAAVGARGAGTRALVAWLSVQDASTGPVARVGVAQDPAPLPSPTPRDALRLSAGLVPDGADEALLTGLVATLGLEPLLDRDPGSLAAGERLRVGLASAAARRPAVLVVDHPEAALDPTSLVDLADRLHRLVRTFGLTVLVGTGDAVLARDADAVTVLSHGRVVERLGHPTPRQVRVLATELLPRG